MDLEKVEWHLWILAIIVVTSVYFVAVKSNIGALTGAANTLFGRALGLDAQGNFQKPFN